MPPLFSFPGTHSNAHLVPLCVCVLMKAQRVCVLSEFVHRCFLFSEKMLHFIHTFNAKHTFLCSLSCIAKPGEVCNVFPTTSMFGSVRSAAKSWQSRRSSSIPNPNYALCLSYRVFQAQELQRFWPEMAPMHLLLLNLLLKSSSFSSRW